MTVDPMRAYVVALLNRANIVPDAGMIATLSLILPLAEADVLALLCEERDAAALWHSTGPGFVQNCITRFQAGDHRGAAAQPPAQGCARILHADSPAPAISMEALDHA